MKQLGFMFMRLIGLASVLSATPTFAINYTGEALLDWSSLTFSGIAIDHAAEDTRFHGTALGFQLLKRRTRACAQRARCEGVQSWHSSASQ